MRAILPVVFLLAAPLAAEDVPGCTLEVVAGGGRSFSGDGGPAELAEFDHPEDAVARPDGSIYVADTGNGRVRRISPEGIVTTILQSPEPARIAVSREGHLFVFDRAQRRIIRRLTNGLVRTVLADAGLGAEVGIEGGPGPSLYLADGENHRVLRLERSGRLETLADGAGGKIDTPTDIALGPDGSLYVADAGASLIWRVWPDGSVQELAPLPVPTPSLYFANYLLGILRPFPGWPSDSAFEPPNARIAVSSTGEIIATTGLRPILGLLGIPGLISGDDSPAAGLETTVYFYESSGEWRPILGPAFDRGSSIGWLPDGRALLASRSLDQIGALSLNTQAMEILAGAGANGPSGDEGPATLARLRAPRSVAMLSTGEIYVGDENRVRVIGVDGSIRASDFSAPAAYLASDADGSSLYMSDGPTVRKRDSGGAETIVAEADVCPRESCGVLFTPVGVVGAEVELGRIAVATTGDLWVAERGAGSTRRLRRVTPSGEVSRPFGPWRPLFGFIRGFGGLDVGADLLGTVVHIDRSRIYRFDVGVGDWREIEGSAGFTGDGVRHGVRDADGDTYLAVEGRVLRLTPEGTLNTVAGLGSDSPLVRPEALAFAPNGDLFIADSAAGLVLRLREPESCDRTVRPQVYSFGVHNAAQGPGLYPHFVPASRLDPVPAAALTPVATRRDAAPGMLASVYGVRLGPVLGAVADYRRRSALPTELAGVSATVGGRPSGVLFAFDSQLNLALPFDLPEAGEVDLVVTVDGVDSEHYPLRMAAARPGVFAVLNADGAPNSKELPAAAGDEVSLVVSGLGRPEVETYALLVSQHRLGWPVEELSVSMRAAHSDAGDIVVQPLWARSRPGEVAGAAEVRFVIPSGVVTDPEGGLAFIRRKAGANSDVLSPLSGAFRLYVAP